MSDHDAAHLHPLTNASTKYQLPTPYSFQRGLGGVVVRVLASNL